MTATVVSITKEKCDLRLVTSYDVFRLFKKMYSSARRETRTLKDITPTASETATFTNFAIRAIL